MSPASLAAQTTPVARAGLVIFALAMGGFAIGTSEFASMSLVPYFSPDLGISEATAAHVISAYALGVVVGAPIIAVLGARMSRKGLLIALMAMYALSNIAAALSPSYGAMLAFRFIAGLPHGAYFGVAMLLAASLVPENRRAWAVSMVMLGLNVATVLGAPSASLMGQSIGWRWGFGLAGAMALATLIMITLKAPADKADKTVNPLRELGALRNRQVWLTLLTGAIGFGGFFAVYTYVASTLQTVTMAPAWAEPLVFIIFGLGMITGTVVTGRFADRNLMGTACFIVVYSMVLMAIYPFATGNLWSMALICFLIGSSGGLALVLQTHLMDVAGEAQTMAAALNHAAFNAGNALGPALASVAVTAGWGFPSSGFVGAGLALGGLILLLITIADQKRV